MQQPLARNIIAVAIIFAVFPATLAQQPSLEESRPRRAKAIEPMTSTHPVEPQWRPPQPQTTISLQTGVSASTQEPSIRVALATNARSGTISTAGHLLNATGSTTTFVALNTARVRVEPRLLSPLRTVNEGYQLQIDGAATRAEAEQQVRELRAKTSENFQITYDKQTASWGLALNKETSREETQELMETLSASGYEARLLTPAADPIPNSSQSQQNSSSIQLVSRSSVPSREVVAIGSSAPLARSSAPLLFASDDEKKSPVRFNDRPYRGQIEVFTNTRGTLTVVNVLGLEDYVRGVVANELSPGGYPALEALKAQAIAARTYALRNRGQFMSQGFDLLPTTRSQVYRGLNSEHPLTTRAVDETRGLVATYNGEPINALYTSTCGGRTEDSENIFNERLPYLRGRECALEGQNPLGPFTLRSVREIPELREEAHVPLARETALLTLENFSMPRSRLTDSWLASEAPANEVRGWLASVARLARQIVPVVSDEVNRPGPFATALHLAVFGETRADVLLNSADVEYFLAIKDANEVPTINRAEVAALVRDGYFWLYPDATLRPRQPLSRARVLHAFAKILEARGLLQLQKGTARPTSRGELVLRANKGRDNVLKVSSNAFLFRQIGERLYQVSSMVIVGGEAVQYRVSPNGEVDYLEVRPANNGAAAERVSPFTNWSRELSLTQVQARLLRSARGIGSILDLRVASRGVSRRVTDIEITGSQGIAHVRGGRIRSVLGLREQLFVIEKRYDNVGRVTGFLFTGRGWGHGVGMCQVGAYGLAKQGLTSDQILKTYYADIEITKLY
ncbi:MAG TPA: SpoIID/LytB domain-containing protein [Pyrinomonadaceae bacterium]|nr:SpoIID/LytB domain-containing protein [Pyrinomonadaceae bacterium]